MTNEKTILEKILEIKSKKSNLISLGCANGWGKETNEMYAFLKEHIIPQTGKETSLGRCYNEYNFDVRINDEVYTVKYTVDSGD
jgi:hypothetical protein